MHCILFVRACFSRTLKKHVYKYKMIHFLFTYISQISKSNVKTQSAYRTYSLRPLRIFSHDNSTKYSYIKNKMAAILKFTASKTGRMVKLFSTQTVIIPSTVYTKPHNTIITIGPLTKHILHRLYRCHVFEYLCAKWLCSTYRAHKT